MLETYSNSIKQKIVLAYNSFSKYISIICLSVAEETDRPKCIFLDVLHQAVADLGEGPRGPGPPLFVEYLQKIYKKMTEMSIQKPF